MDKGGGELGQLRGAQRDADAVSGSMRVGAWGAGGRARALRRLEQRDRLCASSQPRGVRVDGRVGRVRATARRCAFAWSASWCVACVCSLVAAGAAGAGAARSAGTSFAFSFASKGEGRGRLLHPAGVAVNEASGDVYVVDAGNNRIERFGPAGEFIAAWGWGVSDGKAEYEVCTSAAAKRASRVKARGSWMRRSRSRSTTPRSGGRSVAGGRVRARGHGGAEQCGREVRPRRRTARPAALARRSRARSAAWRSTASGRVWVSDAGRLAGRAGGLQRRAVKTSRSGRSRCGLECAETRGLAVDAGGEAFYVSHQLAKCFEGMPGSAPVGESAGGDREAGCERGSRRAKRLTMKTQRCGGGSGERGGLAAGRSGDGRCVRG